MQTQPFDCNKLPRVPDSKTLFHLTFEIRLTHNARIFFGWGEHSPELLVFAFERINAGSARILACKLASSKLMHGSRPLALKQARMPALPATCNSYLLLKSQNNSPQHKSRARILLYSNRLQRLLLRIVFLFHSNLQP